MHKRERERERGLGNKRKDIELNISICQKNIIEETWSTLVAQPVEHLTLDFGAGHDLTVVKSSSTPGSARTAQSLLGILSLSLSLSLCPSPTHTRTLYSLSLKIIHKHSFKRRKKETYLFISIFVNLVF